ncbi:serine/threonine-protein kinase [Nocardiopsis sp. JB363]|uniref:serine/threonine-protein kinase n=1 Tax=Nocardiopsis sp. JB363 TaxID=1434837 RepID=UPI00097B454F|nr:serine/threonine-protein kinase [Nocardiopsis sp. JB363]SIO87079.1 serine/threonine protein kinase [Nocardiopsis sp. JB363]
MTGTRDKMVLEGRYELVAVPMGRGGMGEVYEGRDRRLEREVAVKFIRFPADTDEDERKTMVRRFVRESRITAELQHPGVPAVFDAGSHDGRPYLVMQRIHGVSGSDLISEQERLSVGWSAGIGAQVCSVLAAAHRASLVHRDLKPANLMLEPNGTVKVLDFGLAVALDRTDFSQITRTGHTPGTPEYMAPEQLMAGMATARSDLYALGCILYEMLTGQRLFSATTPFAVATKQANEVPGRVHAVRSDVPGELSELVGALLEKRPEDRPEDAVEVYGHLVGFTDDLEPIPGVLDPPSLPNPHRMYGAVLSRVFGSGGSPAPTREPSPVPQPAPEEGPLSGEGDPASPSERSMMKRARDEAAELVSSSRYRQASDTLREAVVEASEAFGRTDPEVVNLRVEWANVLFEGGDFRQAGPLYGRLAEDLGRAPGSDRSLVFRCRLQDATCRALAGDTAAALESLTALLADEVEAFGSDDHRPLELRRQIGLLELGAGRREEAGRTLRSLREDLVRLRGAKHPAITQIDDLLKAA